MAHTSIPMHYFPSTALFLDDSPDFLLNFVLQLDEGVAYRIFDAPRKALDYIHQKTCALEILNRTSHAQAPQGSFVMPPAVFNPHRFAEISVVIIDYAMPGMDGLEFCRQLENQHIKKILLTGQADEKLAIQAFNEGLIHRYVKKSDINAAHLITKSIYELQLAYFQGMSEKMGQERGMVQPVCLQDQAFVSLFQTICDEHKIIEYYLMDSSGSFLMLDEDANTSMLIVKRESDLLLDAQRAREANDAKDIISYTKGSSLCSVKANRLFADATYYYAYVQGNAAVDARAQKILSYHRYLEEVDAEELLS
jgi:CheY-like chemotaxis protein